MASRTATIAALIAAGLASGTAARAGTPPDVPVACSAAALAAAVGSAGEGATLSLAAMCTYRLTAGLPAIYDDLSIVGHGATLERSTAPGTPQFAIVQDGGGGLTVSDLNFRNGVPAIDFAGTGPLIVNGGLFSENKGAGAITDTSPGNGPVVNGTTFAWNTTTGDGGAIYDFADAGGATVTNSTFYGNTAAGFGGAILDAAQEGGSFSHDVIYDNTAGGGGGGMSAGDPSIENCQIFGNRASAGGGVFIDGQYLATMTGTSIRGNSAEDGGGIYDGGTDGFSVQLADDTITGNRASADGGGVYNLATALYEASLSLAHTGIFANDAGALGGGIYDAGAVTAANTTISLNIARGGGGIYQANDSDGNGAVLTSSAVLRNFPDNCEPPGAITGCNG